MRGPILKGFLYLALYYIAATVLKTVIEVPSYSRAQTLQAVLTPIGSIQSHTVECCLLARRDCRDGSSADPHIYSAARNQLKTWAECAHKSFVLKSRTLIGFKEFDAEIYPGETRMLFERMGSVCEPN